MENYLVSKIDEYDFLPDVTVNVVISDKNAVNDENFIKDIESSFVNHFEQQSINQFKKNSKENGRWWKNLAAGFVFLAMCIFLAQVFSQPAFEGKAVFSVLKESLSIIGWVAIWDPVGHFLFYTKENKRLLRNYMILHRSSYKIILEK